MKILFCSREGKIRALAEYQMAGNASPYMIHETAFYYMYSTPPFAVSNMAKSMERCRPPLLQSEKSAMWRQKARIGCWERKGTVSITTVEMRPLTSTGLQYKGQQQLPTGSAFIKSDKEIRQ